MQVPLLDLKAQYEGIRDEIMAAVHEVFESQYFILGPKVAAFEEAVAEYCGTKHAVGVSSGTDAILASLMALGIGPGDEVVTTPYTFFATAGCISRLGAKPVFVDIRRDTFNIDETAVTRAITENTKAIMPVHLFGRCAEMDPILEAAGDIPVVEDAAQAIGSEYKARRAGSIGNLGCFSFFPSKNLGGAGDGGMVTTNDEALAEKVRILRAHGSKPKYHHHVVGGNFRLDALQAAVLLVKLRHLDEWSGGRKRNADRYRELFAKVGLSPDPVGLPEEGPYRHIYNQFVIRVPAERRDALLAFLKERGIGNAVYYPLPLHMQECFAYLGYGEGDFPESERAARETVALPVYPELAGEQTAAVVAAVGEFLAK